MKAFPFVLALSGILSAALAFANDGIVRGSGFLVDERGYILTAAHVVEEWGYKNTWVIVGGKDRYLAQVLQTDKKNDLALLKVDGKNMPIVKLGQAEKARRQEPVWVIGYPLGYQEISTASGRITAFRESIKQIPGELNVDRLIEIDARVNPGSSGGPLINNRAEAIGIVHAKIAGGNVERTGFAVPLNLAINLLKQIPDFPNLNFTQETRTFTGMEIDAHVAPAVVQIEMLEKLKEDVLKETIKIKQTQEKALKALEAKGIQLPEDMVLIPAGDFIMGSSRGKTPDRRILFS